MTTDRNGSSWYATEPPMRGRSVKNETSTSVSPLAERTKSVRRAVISPGGSVSATGPRCAVMVGAVRQSAGSSDRSTCDKGIAVVLLLSEADGRALLVLASVVVGRSTLAVAVELPVASFSPGHRPSGERSSSRGANRIISSGGNSVQKATDAVVLAAEEGACPRHSCARLQMEQSGAVSVIETRCAADISGRGQGDVTTRVSEQLENQSLWEKQVGSMDKS